MIHNQVFFGVGPFSYTEFDLAKKSGGTRHICAPSRELKTHQRSKLKSLEKYFNNRSVVYTDTIHGFIPNRNVVTAATQHIGFDATVHMDISNFFDNIHMVPSLPKFVNRIPYIRTKDTGIYAQGFCTSPIVGAICLRVPVLKLHKIFLKEFGSRSEYAFTIYADDIQVSINEITVERIEFIKYNIKESLRNSNLEINESKTRTNYAKYGYRRILGVNVGETEVRATRKTMRKLRAAKHQNNGPSIGGLTTWSKCNLPK